MKDTNLNFILFSGMIFLSILIYFEKDIEGIKIIGTILSNLITAIYSYKRGKEDAIN
jgi:hypothetical protein